MPQWLVCLLLAQDWGLPPWQIEATVPAVWVDRWLAVREARDEAGQKREQGVGETVTKPDGTRSKRVI